MTGERKPSSIDKDKLVLAAEELRDAEKRMDAARVALAEAERNHADAHERLMIEARGLDSTMNYARDFLPRNSRVAAGQINPGLLSA